MTQYKLAPIELTQDELKKLLNYDHITGIFTWKTNRVNIKAGSIAGTLSAEGYINIQVNYKMYRAHRLVWLYIKGYFPTNEIDHKNGNKSCNSIDNLRECTSEENRRNCAKNKKNTSGIKGVCFHKETRKWQARARANGKNNYLGLYANIEDAAFAYKEFVNKHHGDFVHQSVKEV